MVKYLVGVPVTDLSLIESIQYNPVTWVLIGLVSLAYLLITLSSVVRDKKAGRKCGRSTVVSVLLAVVTITGMLFIANTKAQAINNLLTANQVQLHYGIIENTYAGGFLPERDGEVKTLKNVKLINKHGEQRQEKIVLMKKSDNRISASILNQQGDALIELPVLGIE